MKLYEFKLKLQCVPDLIVFFLIMYINYTYEHYLNPIQ